MQNGRLRMRLVIEEVGTDVYNPRSGAIAELADVELAEVSADRVAIVEHVYGRTQFAQTFLRVAGDAIKMVAREKLTALLGEVGGTLGMRLKTWAEDQAQHAPAATEATP